MAYSDRGHFDVDCLDSSGFLDWQAVDLGGLVVSKALVQLLNPNAFSLHAESRDSRDSSFFCEWQAQAQLVFLPTWPLATLIRC